MNRSDFEGGNFDRPFEDDDSGEISPIRLQDDDFIPVDDDTRRFGVKYSVADFSKKKDYGSSSDDAEGKRMKRSHSRSSGSEDESSVKGDHGFKSLKSESDTPDEIRPIEPEEARRFCASIVAIDNLFTQSGMNLPGDTWLEYSPRGLFNPSIFCYLNSGIQALGNIPQFSLGIVMSAQAKQGTLLHALSETYKYFWVRPEDMDRASTDCEPIEATAVQRYFADNRSHIFEQGDMHDAEEFMLDMISELENELGHGQDVDFVNPVTKMFRGSIENPQGGQDLFYSLHLNIEAPEITSVEQAVFCHLIKYFNDYRNLRAKQLNADQTGQVSEEDSPLFNDSNDLPGENSSNFAGSDNADLEAECPVASDAVEEDNMLFDTDGKDTFKFHAPGVLLLTLVRPSGIDDCKEVKENKTIHFAAEYPMRKETPVYTYKLKSMVKLIDLSRYMRHYFVHTRCGSGSWFMLNDSRRIPDIKFRKRIWRSRTTTLVYVLVA